MDPITWIDVADSAVKIGLGALIGGIFTMLNSASSAKSAVKKELLSRRRELLEEIVVKFSSFNSALGTFWANIRNACYKRDVGEHISEEEADSLSKSERALFENFNTLQEIRSLILLLGEKTAESSLAKYRSSADDFFKIANLKNPKCTQDKLDKFKQEFGEGRQTFLDLLVTAYLRTGE